MITQTPRMKAADALEFLRSHPALAAEGGDSLVRGLWFYMAKCCKHGKTDFAGKDGIDVYEGDPDAAKWKDRFDAEYADDPNAVFKHVKIPYEEYYGEPWKFDHVEYWYELTIFVYYGDVWGSDKFDWCKSDQWRGFSGPHGGCRTFEEMLIECAEKTKEVYGDFHTHDDRLRTEEEKRYLQERYSNTGDFLKNINSPEWKSGYFDLHDGLTNLRWLEWFCSTDYAKENWSEYVKGEWKDLIEKSKSFSAQYRKIVLGEVS